MLYAGRSAALEPWDDRPESAHGLMPNLPADAALHLLTAPQWQFKVLEGRC